MSRYKYYYDDKNGVVCVSSYAGKKVRAVAKCDPADTFEYERGAALAKARVDVKIGKKRVKRARERFDEATEMMHFVSQYFNDMARYLDDATKELAEYNEALDNLLETL